MMPINPSALLYLFGPKWMRHFITISPTRVSFSSSRALALVAVKIYSTQTNEQHSHFVILNYKTYSSIILYMLIYAYTYHVHKQK